MSFWLGGDDQRSRRVYCREERPSTDGRGSGPSARGGEGLRACRRRAVLSFLTPQYFFVRGHPRRGAGVDHVNERLYTVPATAQRRVYNFRIDPALDARLKAVKVRDGSSQREQIRRALAQWLREKGVMTEERGERVKRRQRP